MNQIRKSWRSLMTAAAIVATLSSTAFAAGTYDINVVLPLTGSAAFVGQGERDALLALQGVETATERKKRAVAKGRNALDVLDRLKLGLLDGSLDQSTLARLKVAAEGLTEESGDSGLDAVLSAIDLRVAVELAKAGVQ